MTIGILNSELNHRFIRPVYLFYGPELYLRTYYINKIEYLILPNLSDKINKNVVQGKITSEKLENISQNLPMFSERKLIIIKNSGCFKPNRNKKNSEDNNAKSVGNASENNKSSDTKKNNISNDLLEIEMCLRNLPSHCCVIFCEDEVDKRSKLFNVVKQCGLVIEFQFQKHAELSKWIIKIFSTYGKKIDSQAVAVIMHYCDQSMDNILNEINKLIAFSGNHDIITKDDVDLVCSKSIKSKVFDLIDTISGNNKQLAFRILEELSALKEPMQKVLVMLGKQFIQLLEIKQLISKNFDLEYIANHMGMTTYIVSRILRTCSRYSINDLKNIINYIVEADIEMKTSKMKDTIVTELLIAQIIASC